VATGAPGGVGQGGGPAGRGAQVSADLAVTPGQTLYVNVGGSDGFNGGGSSSGSGGGGGGASDVRTVSRDQDGSLDSRLIVAGGGGGSGEGVFEDDCGGTLRGAAGGDAGSAGGNGPWCKDLRGVINGGLAGGTSGGAGGQSAGGLGGFSGGSGDGQSGSLGLGGNGGQFGGGAGGGYYGGGGSTNFASVVTGEDPDPPVQHAPGGWGRRVQPGA
jgi:hypothetical protein